MQSIGPFFTVLACITIFTRTDAMSIHCDYDIFPFHLVGVVYRCAGNVTLDSENDDKITAVHGTHLINEQNKNVQGLIISSQNMESFPVNIDSFYPDVTVLNFPLNLISSVTKGHLKPFPNLEFLALYGNRITSLDSDLFAGTKALKFVNLGRNRIKHVGHDIVFHPTAHIYLYSNLCVDRDAVTELEVTYLRFSLMMNCPPSKIQQTTGESLANRIPKDRKDKYMQLAMRVSFSEAFIDGTRCLEAEKQSIYV